MLLMYIVPIKAWCVLYFTEMYKVFLYTCSLITQGKVPIKCWPLFPSWKNNFIFALTFTLSLDISTSFFQNLLLTYSDFLLALCNTCCCWISRRINTGVNIRTHYGCKNSCYYFSCNLKRGVRKPTVSGWPLLCIASLAHTNLQPAEGMYKQK